MSLALAKVAGWFRKPEYRCEAGPDEVFQPVRGEFVGHLRYAGTRYSGLTYDTLYRVHLDKVVAVDSIESRAAELAGRRRIMRIGDRQLRFEVEGFQQFDGLRDIVITTCRREPPSGRVRGTFIADRLVPRPRPIVETSEDAAQVGDEPGVEVQQQADSRLAVQDPHIELTQSPSPELVQEPPVEVARDVGGTGVPSNELGSVRSGEPARIQPRESSALVPAEETLQPVSSAADKAAPPRYLLDGNVSKPPLDDRVGVVRGVVRCSRTGRPLSGTVSVSVPEESERNDERTFGTSGFSLVGPSGALDLRLRAPGYAPYATSVDLRPGSSEELDLRLHPTGDVSPTFTVELTWADDSEPLDLHVIHIGEGHPAYHLSSSNPGNLSAWPYAAMEPRKDAQSNEARARIGRILPGRTFCVVHAPDRATSETLAIYRSGVLARLYDSNGQLVQESMPPSDDGNTWCAFVLIGEEPAAVNRPVTRAPRVSLAEVQRWNQAPVEPESASPGRVAADLPQEVRETRTGDWWMVLCALIGTMLTLLVGQRGGIFAGGLMLLIAIAALYYVWLGGFPVLPSTGRRRRLVQETI